MTDAVDTPIVVNPNPAPTMAATILRYALQALGGFLVARGWMSEGAVEALVSGGLVIAPLAYGAWLAYRNRQKLAAVAEAAPNTVAVVK